MAPALTSNSFVRNPAGIRPKHEPKCQRLSTITHARQNLFGFGKSKNGTEEEDDSSPQQPPANWKKFKSFFVDIELPNAKSLIPVVSSPSTSLLTSRRRKDPQTVFVAGATGQAGIRIAQTLLKQGFTVRAGVPDLPSAQELARIAATYNVISPAEAKRLNAVESAFSEPEAIAKAIGPATKVVVTIGPTEKGPTAQVTTDEALQVVRAAELAAASHVVVVYDASSGLTSGSTYNVIDGITSFFNNLSTMFSRSQELTIDEFLGKVVESDVRYTVIKTALTEDYSPESEHGLVVSGEGNGSGTGSTEFKVAKSKIAALVADVFSNTSVAENKVVKVSTSPSATTKPVAEVLSAIQEDGRRKEYQEYVAKAKAEAEAAREAEDAANKLQQVSKATSAPESTEQEQKEAGPDVAAVLENGLKEFTGKFSWDKLSSQLATAVAQKSEDQAEEEEEEKPRAQIATIRGLLKARKLPAQKAVIKQASKRPQMKPKPKQPETKPEVKKVFGLFKQETIYVEDD